MKETKSSDVIRTVCVTGDAFSCGLSAYVSEGRVIKITPGDFPNQAYKGACIKGLSAHHWTHHPERLRAPLKRMGERGDGKWEEVSWDQALDNLAARMTEIFDRYGPSSIAWSVPDFPYLRQGGYLRLLSLTKGTLVENTGFGDLAGPCADMVTFGAYMGEFFSSFLTDPKLALVWGGNPAETNLRRMKGIMAAKKKGCKVITIDPRFSATAARFDEYIQIRPGTDGALALGMIRLILEKGLEDRDFIIENTVGPLLVRADNGLFVRESDLQQNGDKKAFLVWDEASGQAKRYDEQGIKPTLLGQYFLDKVACRPAFQLLKEMVAEYTPEKVAAITEIPKEIILKLAHDYGTLKPAAIHRMWGVQRTFHGDLTCRAFNTLAAVTGNLLREQPSAFVLNSKPFLMPGEVPTRIPIMLLYDAITKGEPFPIKALCFAGHNFVNQLPNANKIVKELFPRLELILVNDLFMTTTAKYADYVLPAASFLECTDLVNGAYTYSQLPYLQLQQKVIEPLYKCKSDFRIASGLGRSLGFGKYFEKSEEAWIEEALASDHPTMEGLCIDRLRQGPVHQKPGGPPRYRTPTGKIEFYVERMKEFGQELPVYLEPVESNRRERADQFSLSLLTPHHKYRVHSTFANVEELVKNDPEPHLEMNPTDADKRDIKGGDVVDVFNDRGRVMVKVRLNEGIKPGVVSLAQGWWPEHYPAGHLNVLTHDRINPAQQAVLGPNAAFCDVLVEVRKVDYLSGA